MLGVLVTFQYENDFSEAKILKIAEGARSKFEGMPGLRYKVFTVDAEAREAKNLYVWETEEVAKAFGISIEKVYMAKHRVTEMITEEVKRLEMEMN